MNMSRRSDLVPGDIVIYSTNNQVRLIIGLNPTPSRDKTYYVMMAMETGQIFKGIVMHDDTIVARCEFEGFKEQL